MNLKHVTDRWVSHHLDKILSKENQLSEELLLDILKKVSYNVSIEKIGNSLFNSMLEQVIPHYISKKEDPESLIDKVSQVSTFCRLGEYGSYIEWDF